MRRFSSGSTVPHAGCQTFTLRPLGSPLESSIPIPPRRRRESVQRLPGCTHMFLNGLFCLCRSQQLETVHDVSSGSGSISQATHPRSIMVQAMMKTQVAQEKRKKKRRLVHARPPKGRSGAPLKGDKASSSGGGGGEGGKTIVIANAAGAGSSAAFLANILRGSNSASVQFYNWWVQGLHRHGWHGKGGFVRLHGIWMDSK